MTKAEERAREKYPEKILPFPIVYEEDAFDMNAFARSIFEDGYEQAEKDLALTWEDMRRIIRIDEEMMDDPEVHPEWKEEQPYCEEVLRRFNKAKEEKK